MPGRDVSIKKKVKGIHDRFQKDLRYRDAQLKAGRTEEKCIEMDELAQQDFTYRPINWRVWEILEKLVYLSEDIWQKCTDETPIRLPRSSNKDAPSSPWVWRRATCHQFLFTSIRIDIRRLFHLVHDGGSRMTTGGAHKFIKVNSLWARGMSGIKEHSDLLKTLPH